MNKKQEQIKILIDENTEVFANAFLLVKPAAEQIEKVEQELGFKVPENYLWFLNEYGHGGFFFEFLGYGLTGEALFVKETLRQRIYGMPANLLVIENCDEYVACVSMDDGSIVTWSHHDKDGMIKTNACFEDYFIERLNNAIENCE